MSKKTSNVTNDTNGANGANNVSGSNSNNYSDLLNSLSTNPRTDMRPVQEGFSLDKSDSNDNGQQ